METHVIANGDGQLLSLERTDRCYIVDGREVDFVTWAGKRGDQWYVLSDMPTWATPVRDYEDGYPTREQARARAYELMAWGEADYPELVFALAEDYPAERDEYGVCVCGAGPGEGHIGMHDCAERAFGDE
jgi:hypothetical protein